MRIATASVSFIALACASVPVFAQSVPVTRPNIVTTSGPEAKPLNGEIFVNRGLQGAGRLDANTRDFNGETLGSFSGMAINLKTWRRNADGSYSGAIVTLPDRGPNDVGTIIGTSDYRARLHASLINFRPGDPAAPLPQNPASQNQLTITPDGGFLLTDSTGMGFTGRDPGTGTLTRDGIVFPSPASGLGAGRISLDAEGVAFARDGGFYVSDEYAATIYRFDASGRQIGAIAPVPALTPRTGGAINFNSVAPGQSGRRNNQGLEALAITPTGKRLVTILQSATVQDTNGANQQTRNNTRILVYDISANPTPTNPIGHFVLQLPTFTQAGDGSAVNRTAAQSEMLALNDNQFLVLSRDGIGRGAGTSATGTPVFKSVLLVDTTNATNLAGTTFETTNAPIATNGVLNSGIVPVQQVELVNMLNTTQLARFGMNLNTSPSNATSLSEKQEAMALAPVLDERAPQDFFLFIGNDNDFQASNGQVAGVSYNAALSGAGGTGSNDNVFLVYRLSLPTYVDPEALLALETTVPQAVVATRAVATDIGRVATDAAMNWLASVRSVSDDGYGTGFQIWTGFDWNRTSVRFPGGRVRADGLSASGGLDYGFGLGRIGAMIGYRDTDGVFGQGGGIEAEGYSLGGYAALSPFPGLYFEIAGSKTADLDFNAIERPGAYGQIGFGQANAEVISASGEIGFKLPIGPVQIGPFARIDYADVETETHAESGASVSNAFVPGVDYERYRYQFGAEAKIGGPKISLTLRGGYAIEEEKGDTSAVASLISARHDNATATVFLPNTERDAVFGGGRLEGRMGRLTIRAAGEGRFGRGEDEARVTMGVGYSF